MPSSPAALSSFSLHNLLRIVSTETSTFSSFSSVRTLKVGTAASSSRVNTEEKKSFSSSNQIKSNQILAKAPFIRSTGAQVQAYNYNANTVIPIKKQV